MVVRVMPTVYSVFKFTLLYTISIFFPIGVGVVTKGLSVSVASSWENM